MRTEPEVETPMSFSSKRFCFPFIGQTNLPSVRRQPSALFIATFAVFAALLVATLPANAGLALSPAIVDFSPDQPMRSDIELVNNGDERLFVVVEPSEIKAPGTDAEKRVQNPDPQALGLLATPSRLILEPGQRKYVRIALLADAGDQDRIFRVTIKPVVGAVDAPTTGLKILVGYDVLVIQRPRQPKATVTATRSGETLTLKNEGNTNAELFNGRQCDVSEIHCTQVPGNRLYAGATWNVQIKPDLPIDYAVKVGGDVTLQHY
jgi:Mat/Ecp fimbriae periplasmic chaperone